MKFLESLYKLSKSFVRWVFIDITLCDFIYIFSTFCFGVISLNILLMWKLVLLKYEING